MDVARNAALLAARDPASAQAVLDAYQRTFATADGQLVLMAMLRDAMAVRGPDLTDTQRTYHQALTDTVLQVAQRAGYDELSIAGAIMTGRLEGKDHGRGSQQRDAGSGVRLDDGDHERF